MRCLIIILVGLVLRVAAQVPGTPSLLDPALVAPVPASSSVTYLLVETFDATGFDNVGWTESSSGESKEDWTTAPAPLEGAQSLYFDVTATRSIDSPAFTASDTVWISFLWHDDEAALPGATRTFFAIKDSVGGTTVASLTLQTDGDVTVAHGSASNRSTDSLSRNQTYQIWVSYTKGTGANGAAAVYWSTTVGGSKGSARASVSAGTATAQAVSVRLVGYTDLEWHLDSVRVAASEF